ncbi:MULTISPECIES: hypothetical protein [Chromobacteriaceae]|uniref:Pilus assembly protein PilP n=2 Tax=Chromobacteriaceae TaxID=1499392 RepID=A0ABV0CNW4_9NEIS|nr:MULTISPECIES: hypothetical protein [Chromobacteriaceae]AVG16906.1 hypothetical protein CFN79_14185 [Chromobacterium vaccinii]ERD99699.1 hypothetical protein O166_16620 [Pseudogulbenkiania ferrooxidans EGD-HP2]
MSANPLKWLAAAWLALALPAAAETIDSFAKGALSSNGGMPPLPAGGAALALPGPGGEAAQPFDLMFIQSRGKVRKAYIVVGGKYGRAVQAGDMLQEWKIAAVGEDYVDMSRRGKRTRLLMDAGAAISEPR